MKKLLLFFCLIIVSLAPAQEQEKVIIDADTGNEVDDLYALVRGLIEPGWDVMGLNAAQWQASHWSVEETMENSFRLNQVLLSYLKMDSDVQSNRGADARLYDWGNKSQPSAASNFIIEAAQEAEDEKIKVIVLGALTNVASAILDQPSITSDISVYWLGSSYNFENGVMKNVDFNCVMDIQAVDVVFNSDVELHVIPVNVAAQMTMDWQETEDRFKGKHDVLDFLIQRWYNHLDGGRRSRTIWDLALIQAIIFPEYAEQVSIQTSKARGNRKVWYYKDIDADKMRSEFYETTLEYVEGLNE
jgi:inosine-uridine nucleoside N-ribohydrolase